VRPFRFAAVLVLLVVGASGCTTKTHRAPGITERWLQAVSDQGREGLRDEATEEARKYGDPSLAQGKIIPDNPANDERHFSDLEVGKATEQGDTARVPFRVTARLPGDERVERSGTAVLSKTGDTWRVVGVQERRPDEKVPSEGGPLPARAKPGQWLAALAVGVVITVISVVVIELQPRTRTADEA
jgi:hypothetical protein